MSKFKHAVVVVMVIGVLVAAAGSAFGADKTAQKSSHNKQIELSESIVIDALPEDVWNTVRDFDAVSVWLPPVESSTLTHGQNNTPGARRHLTFGDGSTADEQLVAWSAAHRRFTYRLLKGDLPVRHYQSTIAVQPAGHEKSRLIWEGQFDAASNQSNDDARQAVRKLYRSGLTHVKQMLSVED